MFLIGQQYRVGLLTAKGISWREGTLLSYQHPLISLSVDGVNTIFSLEGSAVAYVEVIDSAAEEERERKRATTLVGTYGG